MPLNAEIVGGWQLNPVGPDEESTKRLTMTDGMFVFHYDFNTESAQIMVEELQMDNAELREKRKKLQEEHEREQQAARTQQEILRGVPGAPPPTMVPKGMAPNLNREDRRKLAKNAKAQRSG